MEKTADLHAICVTTLKAAAILAMCKLLGSLVLLVIGREPYASPMQEGCIIALGSTMIGMIKGVQENILYWCRIIFITSLLIGAVLEYMYPDIGVFIMIAVGFLPTWFTLLAGLIFTKATRVDK